MNRGKQLISNTFILGIGTVLPKLTQIIVLPIYTAMLTKSEYGVYDLVVIITTLLIPVVTLQIEKAAFRFLFETHNRDDELDIISNIYLFIVFPSIIASLILYIIFGLLQIQYGELLVIYIFVEILISVTRQIARGFRDNKSYSYSALIQSIISMVLAILFLWIFHFGFFGLLISLIISSLASLTYLFYNNSIFRKIHINRFDVRLLKEMLVYSLPMVPNSISLWIVSLSDRLMITGILGLEASAIYAVANKLPNLIKLVYSNFNLAWQESATSTSKDHDYENYYSLVFGKLYGFLIGITILLISTTPVFFKILIHGEYQDAYAQMPILYLGIFFATLTSFYGGIYIALKQTKKIGIASIGVALINIIINVLFLKKIGIYAASISTLASYFLLLLYRAYDINKIMKIQYHWKRIISYFLVLVFISVISYQRNRIFDVFNFFIGVIFAVLINKDIIRFIFAFRLKKKME